MFKVEIGDSMFTVPYTEDTEKADSYTIHYRVQYDDYSDVFIDTTTPFEIIIDDPCDPPAVLETNMPLVNQEYIVATPGKTYQFAAFEFNPTWCILTYTFVSIEPQLVDENAVIFNELTRTFTFND